MQDPVWKRVLGGVVGLLVVGVLVVVARERGASREDMERWELIVVGAAALAGVAFFLSRPR